MGSARLGIEVFPRGMPEPLSVDTRSRLGTPLYDLLSAYAALRLRGIVASVKIAERHVVLAAGGARAADAADRQHRPMGDARLLSHGISRSSRSCARPRARAPFPPAWSWCAKGRWSSAEPALRAALSSAAGRRRRRCRWRRPPMGEPADPLGKTRTPSRRAGRPSAASAHAGGTSLRAAAAAVRARRSPRACPRASTSMRCWRSCRTAYAGRGVNLRRIDDRWAFRTAEDLAFVLKREVVRAEEAVARRGRNARRHRLPPAGDARGDRGGARRRGFPRDTRRVAGGGLDQAARPAADAGPARDLRHDARLPRPFRAGSDRRPAGPDATSGRPG